MYLQFCNLYNIVPPFLVDEKHLTRFVAFLFIKGLSGGTVKHYLAALRYTHIFLGLGDLQICNMPQLEYVIKGGKKATLQPTRKCLPLNVLKDFCGFATDQFNASTFLRVHACAFLA